MQNSIDQQLTSLIKRYDEIWAQYHIKSTNLPRDVASEFVMAALAAIQRATGIRSSYSQQALSTLEQMRHDNKSQAMNFAFPIFGGMLKSVKGAVDSGYLDTFEQHIHANVFADFIEMAQHLLVDEKCKDAAAVIAGGVLEEHLRKLCVKNSIEITFLDKSGEARPKKSSVLNIELVKAEVYNLIHQQNVTAWLAIRNSAAHGKYDEYVDQQVGLMIQGLINFIDTFPA